MSAVAGKQWSQARCASVRAENWSNEAACQLCKSEQGTLLHRHHCAAITPAAGRAACPASAASDDVGCSQQQKSLWRTRGIGGTRVFVPPRQVDETVTWLKHPSGRVAYQDLDWYVDASQIDTDGEAAAARYGVAAVAVNEQGFVDSTSAAEAWGLWLVVASTPARRTVYTDCRANLTLSKAGKREGHLS